MIRMLLPPSGCTQSHPRPSEWLLPSLHPACSFLLCFCSYPCWPQPPPASVQVWALMAGTGRAQRREGQGRSLESDLLGYEPMPGLEWSQASSLSCRNLSFLIRRGESKTPASEGLCGDTRGSARSGKRHLAAEAVHSPPLHFSLPSPAGDGRSRGNRSPKETRRKSTRAFRTLCLCCGKRWL